MGRKEEGRETGWKERCRVCRSGRACVNHPVARGDHLRPSCCHYGPSPPLQPPQATPPSGRAPSSEGRHDLQCTLPQVSFLRHGVYTGSRERRESNFPKNNDSINVTNYSSRKKMHQVSQGSLVPSSTRRKNPAFIALANALSETRSAPSKRNSNNHMNVLGNSFEN